MQCENCGFEQSNSAKFCSRCGTRRLRTCPGCGQPVRSSDAFCEACGAPLHHRVKAAPPGRETLAPIDYTPQHLADRIIAQQAQQQTPGSALGERKAITALFADIVGSTAWVRDLDPEDARGLIDPVLTLMMEAVHHYEGYVAKSLGDGILALFGAPIAHEDHPQRALYAALRMQQAVKRYGDRLRTGQGDVLQIRIGVHSGEVVVRAVSTEDLHTDYDPVGQTIHLASRLEGLAAPGTIVVSEDTHRMAQGYFEFRSLGRMPVKGLPQPVSAYEVLGSSPLRTRLQRSAQRGLVPFVGRQLELDRLNRALSRAMQAEAQVVGVVGEPGVGKSRLFHEFKQTLPGGCLLLEAFSVSHGKAFAYMPLIELLKGYLQVSAQDSETERYTRVAARLQQLDTDLESCQPYIFYLLGITDPSLKLLQMDPKLRRLRTLEAIRRVLICESQKQPLVLIFEDLQWIDSETQAFLQLLLDGMARTSILLLVNYRPEYQHRWHPLGCYTQLRLQPLAALEAAAMLDQLLGEDPSLATAKPRLLERTQGNPFFLEEVVQALAEERLLIGARGRYRLERPLDRLQMPATVQGVLLARIDRLAVIEKTLLQTLAVIGKELSWSLVLQVSGQGEGELRRLLERLQSSEFIYQRPAFPEVEYEFKHALTQEVVYGSLLREQRALLHERTAHAIEALFAGHLDNHYKALAHHYGNSGNIDRAVRYLNLAAQQAMQQSTVTQAIEHLDTALILLQKLPAGAPRDRLELVVQLSLATAQVAAQGYATEAVQRTYSSALRLCRRVGETEQRFRTLLGLRNYHQVRGEVVRARALAEKLLRLAQDAADPALLVEAHRALGSSCLPLGELALARVQLEQVGRLYVARQHRNHVLIYGLEPGVFGLGYLGWTLWHLGYPDQALQKAQAALDLAHEIGFPFVSTHALVIAAEIHLHRREGKEARGLAEAALALATEHGYSFWGAWATLVLGGALIELGLVDGGRKQLRRGLEAYGKTGSALWQSHFRALLMEACASAGQPKEGLAELARARAIMVRGGEQLYESELLRLEGDLSLIGVGGVRADSAQGLGIRRCYERAIEVARRQGARSLELRAVLRLCQFLLPQGPSDAARQHLVRVCQNLTEGEQTPDMQLARTMLKQFKA